MNEEVIASSSPERLVVLDGIAKRYGGVQALSGVDLEVRSGRIHAIVGENGAGKSTLMKIIAGAERPDSGSFLLDGKAITFDSVRAANEQGIAIVFQELSLFPELDVLANLFLGHEPLKRGLVDRAVMRRRAVPILEKLGLDVDLAEPVGLLRIGEQQLVEIAKALLFDARLLILDEPNSALNAAESERLFAITRDLAARGVAILFISHRLEEVFDLCASITVLRDGRKVRDTATADTTISAIVGDMVGEAAPPPRTRRGHGQEGAKPLVFQGVSAGTDIADVSFAAYPGEVVGLAGLEGSGVTAPFDLLFGLTRATAGTVQLADGEGAPTSPRDAVGRGIALVPADRRTEGLALEQSIGANISLVTAGTLGRFGSWLKQAALDARANARADALKIKRNVLGQYAGSLSGGNQQKVVLAKWLETDPKIILLNDPARGVDIGAKLEIYKIIEEQAEAGRIVLFHSTELQEFAQVCDRVLVFHRGRLTGELAGDDITDHGLLHAINVGVGAASRIPA
ncbi:sugar ABC transporter ATP-binding protein [Bauldia litoralis]|uniref:sugar ABC transporter ATP-binding protein n=3 Tax=Bauldia litoralis TaxID=665467 RepID=UPI003266FA24